MSPRDFVESLLRCVTAVNRLTQSVDAVRAGTTHLAEVTHVATAKVLFVDHIGREVTSLEELYTWAIVTGRPDLAVILDEAQPHITRLFPRRNPHHVPDPIDPAEFGP